MGVTFVAVAAEHPLATRAAVNNPELAKFIEECKQGGVAEADIATMEKKGMPTGIFVTHPLTGQEVEVWVGNYVLMSYGDGAVMAVPAHDERDFAFALKYNLPIRQVVAVDGETSFSHEAWAEWYADKQRGKLVNSGKYDGLGYEAAVDAIAADLAAKDLGDKKVQFRLRDWGISRQRYWGCPIPIIHCTTCGDVPVPDEDLPVVLPDNVEITGTGSPLARCPSSTVHVPEVRRDGAARNRHHGHLRRVVLVLPALRLPGQHHGHGRRARRLLVQGRHRPLYRRRRARHPPSHLFALLHQAAARCRADRRTRRAFRQLLTQGMVVAPTFYRELDGGKKQWINPADVNVVTDEKGRPTGATLKADGQSVVIGGIGTMSKSKNNGVDPQALVDQYGADTARLFIMFASPPDQSLEWSDAGVEGAYRFLRRLWKTTYDHVQAGLVEAKFEQNSLFDRQADLRRKLHQTMGKVADDYGRRKQFNTAIAAVMELLNAYDKCDLKDAAGRALAQESLESIALLLFPIVPHIGQALYAELKPGQDAGNQALPKADPAALKQDEIELMVQVNGELRGSIRVSAEAEGEHRSRRVGLRRRVKFMEGKPAKKVVVVPGRLVNIVV